MSHQMSVDAAYQPITDLAQMYPSVAAGKQALAASDWPRFAQIVEQAPTWDERQLVISCADDDDHADFLRSVMATQPSPLAATMLADQTIAAGWRIRGNGTGDTVSQDQWRRTGEYLDQAEQNLIWACAVDPGFVPAWSLRITNSMALSLGQAESRRRYAHVTAIDPLNLAAQHAMMTELCAKWHGDSATMNSFALKCAEDAPDGSFNPVIIVHAHAENALALALDGTVGLGDAWKSHFARPDVRAQIRWAAQKSVLSPAFRHDPGWVSAVGSFATGLACCEDWAPARYCFEQLGPYASYAGLPFHSNAAARFASLRSTALERG